MSKLDGDYPRPVGPKLPESSLLPADVLLSRGSSGVSDCIVASDGASYSHAALWTGTAVVEATLKGIGEGAPAEGRDVYRFHDQAGAALDQAAAARIVAHARQGIGGPYATSELMLLGMMFTLGLSPRRSLVHLAFDALGERAQYLEAWLQGLGPSSKPLVCTELVSAAFYEASPDRAYALRIMPLDARPLPPGAIRDRGFSFDDEASPPEQARAIETLRAACCGMLQVDTARDAPTERKLLWGSIALEAGNTRRLGVVTPGDLQFSPSLRFCGIVAGA
jgi:hypothetical protein